MRGKDIQVPVPRGRMSARKQRVFVFRPSNPMDADPMDKRLARWHEAEVQIIQPAGCPRNGTLGQVFVQAALSGEFIGLVFRSSLVATERTAVVRDLPAEARDARSVRGRVGA